jgi:hypothetical protein
VLPVPIELRLVMIGVRDRKLGFSHCLHVYEES